MINYLKNSLKKKPKKIMPRIILLEPIWGNNTYPYYFGTIKEVILSGYEVVIIKEKIKNCSDLKNNGLKTDDILIFGYGWLGSEYFHEIERLEDLENIKICFFHKPFNNYNEKIEFIKKSKFSILLSSTPKTDKFKEDTDTETVLFPYGCDDKIFGLNPNKTKRYENR